MRNKHGYYVIMDNICPICSDIFNDDIPIVKTICNHSFHHLCLSLHKKYQNKCPICRTQICSSLPL